MVKYIVDLIYDEILLNGENYLQLFPTAWMNLNKSVEQ